MVFILDYVFHFSLESDIERYNPPEKRDLEFHMHTGYTFCPKRMTTPDGGGLFWSQGYMSSYTPLLKPPNKLTFVVSSLLP